MAAGTAAGAAGGRSGSRQTEAPSSQGPCQKGSAREAPRTIQGETTSTGDPGAACPGRTAQGTGPSAGAVSTPVQAVRLKAGSEVRYKGGYRRKRFYFIKTEKGGVILNAQKENCNL